MFVVFMCTHNPEICTKYSLLGATLQCAACLKYSVLMFVEKRYEMQYLEGSGAPVLYIGHTVLKG
jgi:hypothetical protein